MKPLYHVPHISDFRGLLSHAVAEYSELPAFQLKDGKGQLYDVTYHTFYDDVSALGTVLREKYILNGTNIALIGENRYEWCVSYLAAAAGTGTIVPIDKELQYEDVRAILQTAECQALIVSKLQLDKALRLKDCLSGSQIILCMDENDSCPALPELIGEGKAMLKNGKTGFFTAPLSADDTAAILFTSGTTGTSKGVMLTQNNICSDIRNVLKNVYIGPGDWTLSVLPLHHTYECSLGFLCILLAGGTICFCEGLRHMLKNFKEYKPTILVCVPLLMENIHKRIMKTLDEKRSGKAKFLFGKGVAELSDAFGFNARKGLFKQVHDVFGGELRMFIVGAAAIDPAIVKDYFSFGFKVLIGYGLTECAPLVIGNNDKVMTADTIGVPIHGVEARIENENEKGVGEILVKGPNIMKGYYKNEEATREVLTEDGWLHTGDLGKINPDGTFTMVGRSKNVIVTKNGKNIYPEELEFHINKSPYIKESLASGADEKTGDTVVGVSIFPDMEAIKAKFGKGISTDEVRTMIEEWVKSINQKLPSYKSIRHVDIRENDFIKTTTQKIKRFAKENKERKYIDVDKSKNLDDVIGH